MPSTNKEKKIKKLYCPKCAGIIERKLNIRMWKCLDCKKEFVQEEIRTDEMSAKEKLDYRLRKMDKKINQLLNNNLTQ